MKKIMHINNEKGVALLMVLLIATITLAVTSTMLYMLVQSSRYSGLGKRFATASEAAMAATEVYTEFISQGDTAGYRVQLNEGPLQFFPRIQPPCEALKLATPNSEWGACDSYLEMDPTDPDDPPKTYDSMFKLGNYDIYTKIVYTFKGNTIAPKTSGASDSPDPVGGWRNTCVVHCQGGDASAGGGSIFPPVPYTYVIEIDARNRLKQEESAKISVLYQY